MFLLFGESGHVRRYSGVKSLHVCVDLGSLRAVKEEANCSLAQKIDPCFHFYAVCFSVVFSLPQIVSSPYSCVAPHCTDRQWFLEYLFKSKSGFNFIYLFIFGKHDVLRNGKLQQRI